MKKILGFKLKSYNFFLIIMMAVINILLCNIALYLNANHVPIPFWLDSIGTFIAAIEAGPIAGALTGLPVYGIYIFTRPDWALFSLNSILIGITVGIMARTIGLTNWKNVVLAGMAAALIDIVLSSFLDQRLYGGYLDSELGDRVFKALIQSNPMILASLTAEAVMSIPDKVVSALLAFMICSSYDKKGQKNRINTNSTAE